MEQGREQEVLSKELKLIKVSSKYHLHLSLSYELLYFFPFALREISCDVNGGTTGRTQPLLFSSPRL
jgi:hypothetical protein